MEESISERVDVNALQENLEGLGFTVSLAKREIKNKIERRRARSQEKVKSVRVTHTGGRDTSEMRCGIEENKRQPVMTQMIAW